MATKKHLLAEMSFVEFRERMAEKPVILLPLGSQEEQGPHAPMGDWMLAERISAMIAEKSGAIMAPIMPFAYAEYFRVLPGGVAIRAATFCAVLEDFCDAFLAHGLEHLVIINGHTGNSALIDQTMRKIKRERGVIVPCLHLWRLFPDSEMARLHGANVAKARGHGADPLTSIYKHLFPSLVREDLIEPSKPLRPFGLAAAGMGGVTFEGSTVSLPLDVTEATANGVTAGDASFATAEIGAEIVGWLVEYVTRFVGFWRGCDPREVG